MNNVLYFVQNCYLLMLYIFEFYTGMYRGKIRVLERTSAQDRHPDAERMEGSDAELVATDSVDVELLAGRGE